MKKTFLFIILTITCMLCSITAYTIYKKGRADFYMELANVCDELSFPKQGKFFIERSIALLEDDPEKTQELAKAYRVYGTILYHQKDYDHARKSLLTGIEYSQEKSLGN